MSKQDEQIKELQHIELPE